MKTHIDSSLVRQLITTQFPKWSNISIKPVESNGWDNSTFHLGEHMTARLPTAAEYSSQPKKEYTWLPKLAQHLPLSIPTPLELGQPTSEYPWHWSIYKWIEGNTASIDNITNLTQFAISLGKFLSDLQKIDATKGPIAGPHNFHRGGSLKVYDHETRQTIKTLSKKINAPAATKVWDAALASSWKKPNVWIHGDIAENNLLVKNGRLHAVIDFGTLGVGDPACDLVIAWTMFKQESRTTFKSNLPLDKDTWNRARGWALWKSLISYAAHLESNPLKSEKANQIINEILENQ